MKKDTIAAKCLTLYVGCTSEWPQASVKKNKFSQVQVGVEEIAAHVHCNDCDL